MPQRILAAAAWFLLAGLSAVAQAPAPPAATPPSPSAPQPAPKSDDAKRKYAVAGYVISGTVFTENAMAFPGIAVRVRLLTEKKYRWQGYTNSRGEFAIRVPVDQKFEILIHEKKYKDVVLDVSSRPGELAQPISVRMEPSKPPKGDQPK